MIRKKWLFLSTPNTKKLHLSPGLSSFLLAESLSQHSDYLSFWFLDYTFAFAFATYLHWWEKMAVLWLSVSIYTGRNLYIIWLNNNNWSHVEINKVLSIVPRPQASSLDIVSYLYSCKYTIVQIANSIFGYIILCHSHLLFQLFLNRRGQQKID